MLSCNSADLGSHLTDRALLSNRADTHIFLSLCHISLRSYSCRPECSSLHNVLPHTLGERERKNLRWELRLSQIYK